MQINPISKENNYHRQCHVILIYILSLFCSNSKGTKDELDIVPESVLFEGNINVIVTVMKRNTVCTNLVIFIHREL